MARITKANTKPIARAMEADRIKAEESPPPWLSCAKEEKLSSRNPKNRQALFKWMEVLFFISDYQVQKVGQRYKSF
jgi:hypothetical protein